MPQIIKEAITHCKTLLRNGYDAHVINAPLQARLLEENEDKSIDIACEPDFETLVKMIPNVTQDPDGEAVAILKENGKLFRFYSLEVHDAAHPELALLRITPHLLRTLDPARRLEMRLSAYGSPVNESKGVYDGFESFKSGQVRLSGLADETLRHNYLLAIRALRYAANFDLPIAPNTWLAIVRSGTRVLDYVPVADIMDEWRMVRASSMWKFTQLLYDSHILQGLIPELTALSCVKQNRVDDGPEETVFSHTIQCMKRYAEEDFKDDWLGTMAMMFHDIGKLYTGEYYEGRWTFYQHHQVGAKVTRKILRRLHFLPEDIDTLCHLVHHHMRFHFMLTDRGIRRFKALDEYPRLMEMTRADIKARSGSYTYYNHNLKYLNRAETPEQLIEPLLNGNQIMHFTNLPPGPRVGLIRDALLKAQIGGEVSNIDEAEKFVKKLGMMAS